MVRFKISVLLPIKNWTFWYVERLSMRCQSIFACMQTSLLLLAQRSVRRGSADCETCSSYILSHVIVMWAWYTEQHCDKSQSIIS